MQIHEITRIHKNKKKRVVGRGGRHAKTSGRGTKGQNARAGRKKRPELRDIIKKLPKKRGYHFKSITDKPVVVHLDTLAKRFDAGEAITRATLLEKKVIQKDGGMVPSVKVLSRGEKLTKKLSISGCQISATAKDQVLAAGGTVTD